MSYNLRATFTILGIEFIGFLILKAVGYDWLFLPFTILLLIGTFLLPNSLGKPRYKAYRENLSIPAKFKHFEDELLALGFELDCLLELTPFYLGTKQWVYRNREEHVEAYINESTGRLWFSSYFEKRFDVTTRFQHGEVFDNKKIVSQIVKTSIPAAFDYHLQHRQKYTEQYGAIILFESAEQQIEWELQQNLDKEIKREAGIGLFKTLGRMALAFVVMLLVFVLLSIPLMFYLINAMPEQVENVGRIWSQGYSMIGMFAIMAYALWPFIFPKTVEDRKGKKNVEASKDEKQDPYPF
jgi:hypothetical protein